MSLFTLAIGLLFGFAMLLLIGPLAIVLSISLTASETLRFPPPGFSARWYASLLDSPHKVVIAPTVNLPFGEGHKWAQSGVGDALLGGWSVTTVVTFQAGFPIGVSQNENTASFLFGGTLLIDGNAGSGLAASIRGGTVVVRGDAAARAGVSMKGGTLLIGGSCGYMAGFMMQKGKIVVCGNAGGRTP